MAGIVGGLVLLGVLVLWVAWMVRRGTAGQDGGRAWKREGPRLLKPRTPTNCARCRQEDGALSPGALPPLPVRPWREEKSRRGRPKRVPTEGFACQESACRYRGITDAQVHALVGDGAHGRHERIQTFRCQACGRTFTARRDTPLYRLKTPGGRVGEVLTALAEGVELAAVARIFGYRHATITRWLTRAGAHSARLHHHWLHDLCLPHVQLDEIRTRLRRRADVLWLWVALDPRTKLIPVLHLGPRTQEAAHTVIHRLTQTLAPGCLPVFTSDGLNLYFYALTAHFGRWVDALGRQSRQWQVAPGLLYGQVKKVYRCRRLVQVTPVVRCGTRAALRAALLGLGWSGRLNTAFVERVNLTLRCSVAALARRTWATRQKTPQLLAHVEWWRAYYHFCRPHASLRVASAPPSPTGGAGRRSCVRQRTPAMAAGLTSHRWRVGDLLAVPLPAELRHAI
jgi:IS1 family transposase